MRRIKEAEGSAASRNQLHCSRSPRKGGRKAVGAERDLHEACVEVACRGHRVDQLTVLL